MIRPNYRDFRLNSVLPVVPDSHIQHSAKGSTWEDHKYVKKIDGVYYYPVGYEDGRTVDSLKDSDKDSDDEDLDRIKNRYDEILKERGIDISKLSKEEIDKMQREDYDKMSASKKEVALTQVKEHFDEYMKERGVDVSKLSKEQVDEMQKVIYDQIDSGNNPDKILKELGNTEKTTEELAKEVIKGKYGNGQERKDQLGEKYTEVQAKVNELMKGSTGSKKTSEATEETKTIAKSATAKVAETKVHSGVDMNKVLEVYNKKK